MSEIEWARLIEIKRDGIVERTIYGSVVIANSERALSSTRVDPLVFGRSLMKPFQMKAVAADLDALDWEEKAVALASHNGTPKHVDVVRRILTDKQIKMMALPASSPMGGGSEKSIWTNPCSGKHAAILRACESRGWPLVNYLENDHPFNVAYRALLAQKLGFSIENRKSAPDGCLLPTYALHLSEIARLFAGLAKDKAEDWIWDAQHRHPDLVGGHGRLDSTILATCPQVFAKEGADGLLGLAIQDERFPKGLGIVIKLAHGYDMTVLWHLAEIILRDLAVSVPPPPAFAGQQVVAKGFLHDLWERSSH